MSGNERGPSQRGKKATIQPNPPEERLEKAKNPRTKDQGGVEFNRENPGTEADRPPKQQGNRKVA